MHTGYLSQFMKPLFLADSLTGWTTAVTSTTGVNLALTEPVHNADWYPGDQCLEITADPMPAGYQIFVQHANAAIEAAQNDLVISVFEFDGDMGTGTDPEIQMPYYYNERHWNVETGSYNNNHIRSWSVLTNRHKGNTMFCPRRFGDVSSGLDYIENGSGVDHGQPFNHNDFYVTSTGAGDPNPHKTRFLGWFTMPRQRGVITLSLDDCNETQYTVWFQLAKKYNMPFTLFVQSSVVGTAGYITQEQLREMADHPLVELSFHTVTHDDLTTLTPTQLQTEIDTVESYLNGFYRFDRNFKTLSSPFGNINQPVWDAFKARGYRLHRTAVGSEFSNQIGMFLGANGLPRHPEYLRCHVDLGNGHDNAADVLQEVDVAIDTNQELGAYGHSFTDGVLSTDFIASELEPMFQGLDSRRAAGNLIIQNYRQMAENLTTFPSVASQGVEQFGRSV